MSQKSEGFQVFVKPVGALCNLDCRYCYYHDPAVTQDNIAPAPLPGRMSDILLEEYIVQHVEASADPVIRFSWHGGEPTLMGLEFFQKAAAYLDGSGCPLGSSAAPRLLICQLILFLGFCEEGLLLRSSPILGEPLVSERSRLRRDGGVPSGLKDKGSRLKAKQFALKNVL